MKIVLTVLFSLFCGVVSAATGEDHWSTKYFSSTPAAASTIHTSTSTMWDIASSSNTFAACKAADVITTGYGLATGRFFEKNSLIAPLVSHGIWPLALISLGMWYLADRYGTPNTNVALNAVTCPVAAHNAWLLLMK